MKIDITNQVGRPKTKYIIFLLFWLSIVVGFGYLTYLDHIKLTEKIIIGVECKYLKDSDTNLQDSERKVVLYISDIPDTLNLPDIYEVSDNFDWYDITKDRKNGERFKINMIRTSNWNVDFKDAEYIGYDFFIDNNEFTYRFIIYFAIVNLPLILLGLVMAIKIIILYKRFLTKN